MSLRFSKSISPGGMRGGVFPHAKSLPPGSRKRDASTFHLGSPLVRLYGSYSLQLRGQSFPQIFASPPSPHVLPPSSPHISSEDPGASSGGGGGSNRRLEAFQAIHQALFSRMGKERAELLITWVDVFWTSLLLLQQGLPDAFVESITRPFPPSKNKNLLLTHCRSILSDQHVREALAILRQEGLRGVLAAGLSRSAYQQSALEIAKGERFQAVGKWFAAIRDKGSQVEDDLGVQVRIEFFPARKPPKGLRVLPLNLDNVARTLSSSLEKRGVQTTHIQNEGGTPLRFPKVGDGEPFSVELLEFRGKKIIVRWWRNLGTVFYSLQESNRRSQRPARIVRVSHARTIFDAKDDAYKEIGRTWGITSLDDVKRLVSRDKQQQFIAYFPEGESDPVLLRVFRKRRREATIRGVNVSFRFPQDSEGGGRLVREFKIPIRTRTFQEVLDFLDTQMGSSGEIETIRLNSITGIHLSEQDASIQLAYGDPHLMSFAVLQFPWLRSAQLPLVGQVTHALTQRGYRGATDLLPLGMQLRAEVKIRNRDNQLSVKPFLSLLRAFWKHSEEIVDLIGPNDLRRPYVHTFSAPFRERLMNPHYAPRDGNIPDLLCFLGDCVDEADTYRELNIGPFLHHFARAVIDEVYAKDPHGSNFRIEDWFGKYYFFGLHERIITQVLQLGGGVDRTRTLYGGGASGMAVPHSERPFVELRLVDTPERTIRNGQHAIDTRAIEWAATWWKSFATLAQWQEGGQKKNL